MGYPRDKSQSSGQEIYIFSMLVVLIKPIEDPYSRLLGLLQHLKNLPLAHPLDDPKTLRVDLY